MHNRCSRPVLVAALASLWSFAPLQAQAGLPLLGDASTPARGTFRLHAATAWSRYDARFNGNGTAPLGALFTADSLGAREIPALGVTDSLLTAATGVPFRLSMGRSRLDATAREEIIPLTLEYGLTNRISVGVMVPVVRKRLAVQFQLDTAGGFRANVGPNQHRTNPAAAQNNAAVQAQFASAAEQLQSRLANCRANPSAPGCSALLAREAEAQALIISSLAFAAELEMIYGSATNPGQPFVPLSSSDAQATIELRIAAFNAQYRNLLTASADLLTARPIAAGGPPGVADLQRYFATEAMRDSVVTQERVGIGDVEVGVKMLVFERLPSDGRRTGVRVALASALRLGTGSDESPSEVADLRLGSADERLDTRVHADATLGRFGVLATARFESALGSETALVADGPTPDVHVSDRRVIEMSIAPRWHLSTPLSFHAAYSLRSGNRTGSYQLVGGGVAFSGLSSTPRGRTPPVEMRFTHLETISGAAGRPRFFRDQIELRIYYRLLR